MTAAVITATTVAKFDKKADIISGVNKRFKQLYLEGLKAAQNDWFLLSTYLTATELTNIIGWRAIREASGNAHAIDVVTYDSDDYKVVLTEATAGTAFVIIDYFEG